MKRITIILSFLALLALASCSKWLDVKPQTQVQTTQLFSNQQGYEDAMYGVYTTAAFPSLYGDQLTMSFLDVLAQRYSVGSNPLSVFYQASKYNYQDPGTLARITNIWDSMYYAIANVNNILANIDANKSVFQGNDYSLIKGEALGMRAFLHFDLLRMFGPAYASNPTQACIPYVKDVSGNVTALSTVTQVLDSCIADLNAGEALLKAYPDIDNIATGVGSNTDEWLNYRQNHFNYWAAEATLARIYLYMGDKANALLHATNVINSGMFQFVTSDNITTFSDYTFVEEQIFSLSRFNIETQVAEYFNSSGAAGSSVNNATILTNTYGSGGVVNAVYETASGGVTDYRYAYLWQQNNNVYFPTKFWQASASSQYDNLIPLIRLPEMYYIAAESSDPATATTYLNTVRVNRGLSALPAGLTAAQVQNEIFKEYEKEFYCEGQLFYYYKRLNLPQIQYSPVPTSNAIYVFPLPANETQFGNR
jgi:hypothetical protein